jgi:eukaryotic-like serine/threonine-protein kinase
VTGGDEDAWLIALGAEVSDGRRVDWDAAERRASDSDARRVVTELRRLADVLGARGGGPAVADHHPTDDSGAPRVPAAWRHLVILEPVGTGAFGSVYRAWDTRLDREVALKLLPGRTASARPPLDEARLLARVRHPNVVSVYGADEDDDAAGIWMEFIEGRTLADFLLAQGPMSAREAAGIGLDLCRAVAALNAAGLVHRDLKAHNVMRQVGGRIVLMDFSGARAAEALTTRDQLGTPLYMAPELLDGDGATTASEIYSLGVLLFYLLSGRHPVEGATLKDVRAAHVSGERLALRALRPELDDAVVRIIERATSKDSEARYRTAGDLERALLAVLGAEAARDGIPEGGTPRGNGRRWAAIGAIALAAVAATVIWRPRPRSPDPPVVQFSIPVPVNTGSWPRVSPDGRWVVFGAPYEGRQVLWVRALNEPDPRPLAMASGRETSFWSPDSRSLAYFDDEKLKRVGLDGGAFRTLADAPAPRGGTWSPEGVLLFAPTGTSGLHRVRADGTGPAQVTAVNRANGEFEHSWPEFLPGGRRFLFMVRNRRADRGGVFIGSLDRPGHSRLMPSFSRVIFAAPGDLLFTRAGSLVARHFDPDAEIVSGDEVPVASRVKSHVEGDGAFDVSANGVLVYRRNEGLRMTRLSLLDRSSRELKTVGAPALYRHPRFSPDGRRLVAERATSDATNADIWLFDVARGTTARLTQHPAADLRPAWSPDGRSIAFSSARGGDSHLYQLMIDHAGEDRPLLATEGDALLDGWLPDGRSVVATLTRGGVWLLSLDGRAPVPLRAVFPQGAEPSQVSVSPTGRWIAYMAADSGTPEVYVEPVPPTGERWQVSTEGGADPQWRADGREMYYIAADGWLMVTDVLSAAPFRTGRPRRLFSVAVPELHGPSDYAVSPDGQRFVVNTVLGPPAIPPIQVVVNWRGLASR